jgi:ABC-type polysaccharide/polyol phosphate transport system ATPase subunit
MKQLITSKRVTVKLINVSKKYEIHHEKPTFVEKFVKGANENFWALRNISLEIKKGEKIGIIGPNGSGKTTLLKIIVGIATPTKGTVVTNGKIISLIDLEAGFHPDLSGLQNIYLNGMILGMSKKDIDLKLNKIISFADIGSFIDTPIYMYSSGMLLRLGFSIAIHAEPEILILDENISVGDKDFRKKALEVLDRLFSEDRTIIIASHDLDFIERNCRRVIWIHKGKLIADGSVRKVIDKYKKS